MQQNQYSFKTHVLILIFSFGKEQQQPKKGDCKLNAFSGALSGIASMLMLMVIALDRYFVAMRPLASMGVMSKKKALLILFGVWLYALACPPFIGWGK